MPSPRSFVRAVRDRPLAAYRRFVPSRVRAAFRLELIASALAGLYQGAIFPFLVKVARDDLGAAPILIGWMVAAPFLGHLLSPVWARQMETGAKKPWAVGSWLAARTLILFLAFVSSPLAFVLLIGGAQMVGTVSSPAYASLMKDIYPDHQRGSLMGTVRMVLQACVFIAAMVAGRLLDTGLPFQVLFPAAAVLGLAAAVVFSRIQVEETTRAEPPSPEERREPLPREMYRLLAAQPAFCWFVASIFIYGFANLCLTTLFPLYQVDRLRISGTEIANLANIASLATIVSVLFWGRFMDRVGPLRTVMINILILSLSPLVYLVATRPMELAPAALVQGIALGGMDLAYLNAILRFAAREPHKIALYQSIHAALLGVRGVLAPFISVWLLAATGYQYRPLFVAAFVLMGVGCILQWRANRLSAEVRVS